MPRRVWFRFSLAAAFAAALVWAQFRESGDAGLAAHLELAAEPRMPVRVYLFKDGRPFRLSPVQAMLPLRVDLLYRERLWRAAPDPATLEVTCNDQSHFFLLKGEAGFDLPAGKYRVEAYRGTFYVPAVEEFELRAGQKLRVPLRLRNWAGPESEGWIAGDDHIHLTRAPEDDPVYLRWLEAEDLHVGNFLQLQRQMDAAVQYAFGPRGEARDGRYAVRPGQESRTEFYGHVNLLGGRELIRPVSGGSVYANSPEAWPWPAEVFARGRRAGATVGYAHFNGSTPHSALLMDLALGHIDFLEVFQFGVLKTREWYQLLNAGLRVTGIAGSDFPVPLNRLKAWPRFIPLLGPERTLVKAQPGAAPYDAWAAGIRSGNVVVSNGPLVEIAVEGGTATARARFFRPLTALEIIHNGRVVASAPAGQHKTELRVSAPVGDGWMAARASAEKREDEPDIQAHTNPVYTGKPFIDPAAREALAQSWEMELAWYRNAGLVFPSEDQRRRFFSEAGRALSELRRMP